MPNDKINEAFKELKQEFAKKILALPEEEREKHLKALETLKSFSDFDQHAAGSSEGYKQLHDADRAALLKALIEGKDKVTITKASPPDFKEVSTDYDLKDIRKNLGIESGSDLYKEIEESLRPEEKGNPKKSKATQAAEDLLKNMKNKGKEGVQERDSLSTVISSLTKLLEDSAAFGTPDKPATTNKFAGLENNFSTEKEIVKG